MARSLPSNYTDTLATSAVTRNPSAKVEIEYGAAWHDVSADVISVSIAQTMENRADEAQVKLANADRLYSRLWSDQADPPTSEGHRVRVWMTNSPADLIQVFLGHIVQGSNVVKRGEPEAVSLRCMDAGRKAWLNEITMEPRLGRAQVLGGGGYRSSAANRQINAIVTAILEHSDIGFGAGDIDLAAIDYSVAEWKPGTFNPMSDIAQLLGVRHHFLRFNWEGKAVSAPIIPTGASSWTYGAYQAYPLHVSFEERWQEPERMASVVNVLGWEMYAMPEVYGDSEKLWEDDCYYGTGNNAFEWTSGSVAEDFYFAIDPLPEAYGDLQTKTPYGHLEDVNLVVYQGMREPPYQDYGIIRVYWQGAVNPDDYVHAELWGRPRVPTGGQRTGTATNTTLSAAGYAGVVEENNDYVSADADCEWLAQRLVTWLANECHPATLVVPCNLVHEPGDLITVNLDKYGGAAALGLDYIVVSHKIDYEKGKPNLSTLELVRDTTHMW